MTKTEKKIAELEKRVQELEARPQILILPAQLSYPAHQPQQNPQWYTPIITCGATGVEWTTR